MSAGERTALDDARARWFFALWPSPRERELAALAAAALALGSEARRVPAENYHVTIAFVGAVAAAGVERLRLIGRESAAACCTLRFDAYEYWPKPQVLVAAAHEIPAALEQLWHGLHASLAVQGVVLTPKRLRPHITFARNVALPPDLQAPLTFMWTAEALCLVRSDSGVKRALYTVVDRWPLLDEAAKP